MEPIMKIKMFGGLSIQLDDRIIVKEGARINKPLELLVLLLQGRGTSLGNEQLMERLWEDEELDNPMGALKNTVYLLRKLLRDAAPGVEFIFTEGHKYQWNPAITTKLDMWEFEDVQVELYDQKGMPCEKRLTLLRRAVKLYAGDFLPTLQNQRWVLQQSNYLRQLYLSDVVSISTILLESGGKENASEVVALCNNALLMEPLSEELQICLFRAMQRLDMKTTVSNYYQAVSSMFFNELGELPPADVRSIYMWATGGNNTSIEDIRQIQMDLEEAARDMQPVRGAYYCPYDVFKHIFHIVVRNATRVDNSVILMLITLNSGVDGVELTKGERVLAMLKLEEVVREALRRGDVFSRYSRNQYVIMLSLVREADSKIVWERINRGFLKQNPSPKVKLTIVAGKPKSTLN